MEACEDPEEAPPENLRRLFVLSRESMVERALSVGRLWVLIGLDPRTGWWKELARLSEAEVAEVREALAFDKPLAQLSGPFAVAKEVVSE